MPSKTSKTPPKPRTPTLDIPKAATVSSEAELAKLAAELARALRPRDWVLLEGPLGAGKTTFAKAVLEARGVKRPPEGSPTFAIAHEYEDQAGVGLIHLDLYRLRSEAELDEAGVPEYFWEREAIVLCEWLSMWPEFESRVLAEAEREGREVYRVGLEFAPNQAQGRSVGIKRLSARPRPKRGARRSSGSD